MKEENKKSEMILEVDQDKGEVIIKSNKALYPEAHIFLDTLDEQKLENVLKENAQLIMSMKDTK